MANGTRATSLPAIADISYIIGINSGGSVGRLNSTALGTILAASGAVADAITGKADSADLSAATARIDALEAIGATGAQYTPGGPVACATTANITLSGEQTIDGVTTSTDRVLVMAQTDPAENGIYVSAAGAWARATDMDAAAEVNGTLVFVQAGTANGLTTLVTYSAVETLGTDDIVWREAGDASAVSAALALKADAAGPTFTGVVDMSGADSVPVPTPTADTHAATKGYVDDAVSSVSISWLEFTQDIGLTGSPASSTAFSGQTYVFADPLERNCTLDQIDLWAVATGALTIRRFRKSGDAFSQIGTDLDVTVSSTGSLSLVGGGTDFATFEALEGEYLGFYSPDVAGRVAETGSSFYMGSGDATGFTDAGTQNNINIQIRFTCGARETDLIRDEVEALDNRVDAVESLVDDLRPTRWLGVQGEGNLNVANENMSPARQVVPAHAVPFDGSLTSITIQAGTAGTITVRTMERTGAGTFTQVLSQDIAISSTGFQTLVAGTDFTAMNVTPGQYIALDVPADLLGQAATEGFPVYIHGTRGDTTFEDTSTQSNICFQVGFEVTADEAPSAANHGFIKGREGFFINAPANGILTGDIGYGQSWMGNNSTAIEADIMKTAHFPMNALMFLDGLKSEGSPFSRSNLAPLRGNDEDPTILGPMCNRIVGDGLRAGVNRVNMAWQLGIGGQSLEELTSPDFAYHDTDDWYVTLLGIVDDAVQAAEDLGCRYEVATLVWCQGAGGPGGYSIYKTRFGELVDKVQEDIVAATGQKMKPTIIVIQPPGYVSDNLQALVDICAERGDVVLGAVGWGYPRIDSIHFDAEGCIQLGEILGIARSHIDQGRPWSAPYLRDVTRSGTTITANVGGPLPIVVDESIDAIMHYIPDGLGGTEPVPNHGFEYTGANITDVVVEPSRVTITLDADASGTLNFARSSTDHGDTNGNGNRGTIRADALWPPLFATDDLRLWMASGYWDL